MEKLGVLFLWVDTCCFFNESSAEWSEGINSMFASYLNARVCFVYMEKFDEIEIERTFDKSTWWTRGWMLQVPRAPTEVRGGFIFIFLHRTGAL